MIWKAAGAPALGVSEQTLYRWRDDFNGAGKQAMNGRGAQSEQTKALGGRRAGASAGMRPGNMGGECTPIRG